MIRLTALLGLITLVSACGADGEPDRPEPRPANGVAVSGTAEMGVPGGT